MNQTEAFSPPKWLQNPHAQTILASLKLRRPAVRLRNRRMLRCAEAVVMDLSDARLQAQVSPQPHPAPLAVLLHGWEGSHNSLYILDLAGHLYQQGYSIARLNLRDHGDTHHLNRALFHSNRLQEVVEAVQWLDSNRKSAGQRLCLAGFSLGGNFAARIARHAPDSLALHATCAISPVINPVSGLATMSSARGIYRRHFLTKWHRSLRAKQAAWPDEYDFAEALALQSMSALTDYVVRHYTDYPSSRDYLEGYSIAGERLRGLGRPLYILAARDDPLLGCAVSELAESPLLRVDVTEYGGHCGFRTGSGRSWHCNWVEQCFAPPRSPAP